VKVPDPAYPGDDSFARTEVHVSDTCATGTTDARVAGPQESLAFLKLPDADTRPGSTVTMSTFAVVVKEIERRFRGREVRLTEGFVRRGDAFCCPSVRKTTYLRYDAARDRYVRYRTRVRRLRVR
jgi:hypothetical protein